MKVQLPECLNLRFVMLYGGNILRTLHLPLTWNNKNLVNFISISMNIFPIVKKVGARHPTSNVEIRSHLPIYLTENYLRSQRYAALLLMVLHLLKLSDDSSISLLEFYIYRLSWTIGICFFGGIFSSILSRRKIRWVFLFDPKSPFSGDTLYIL